MFVLKDVVNTLFRRELEMRVFRVCGAVTDAVSIRLDILKVEMALQILGIESSACENPRFHDRNQHVLISKLDREIDAPFREQICCHGFGVGF